MSCLAFVVRRANPVRLVMCTVERGCHRVDGGLLTGCIGMLGASE